MARRSAISITIRYHQETQCEKLHSVWDNSLEMQRKDILEEIADKRNAKKENEKIKTDLTGRSGYMLPPVIHCPHARTVWCSDNANPTAQHFEQSEKVAVKGQRGEQGGEQGGEAGGGAGGGAGGIRVQFVVLAEAADATDV
ncbi:hypothetical protein C0Q70_10859 [Pomacea canaliculata]|uniref:Uncharacterized protein n=1 Tax=Pomacea canaliculata TaxID=400727 RepID=A0A2T7P4B9_POMCA|nr:hypothetical protein C0Q70_10859 [Pomacea canaliculata]